MPKRAFILFILIVILFLSFVNINDSKETYPSKVHILSNEYKVFNLNTNEPILVWDYIEYLDSIDISMDSKYLLLISDFSSDYYDRNKMLTNTNLEKHGIYLSVKNNEYFIIDLPRLNKYLVNGKTVLGILEGNKLLTFNEDKVEIIFSDFKLVEDEISNNSVGIMWDYNTEKSIYTLNPKMEDNIDIIMPTWFSLSEEGELIGKVNEKYLNEYELLGIRVHPLISNSFSAKNTRSLLSDLYKRKLFIEKIKSEIIDKGISGINIDFEAIPIDLKDEYNQFMKQIKVSLGREIIISIDVHGISESYIMPSIYDYDYLNRYMDLIIIMAYDQYYSGSTFSGPVSSLYWFEENIKGFQSRISNDKIIIGIPLYSRIWYEDPKAPGIRVDSKALGMKSIDSLIKEKKLNLEFDELSGLYYIEYLENNIIKKAWVENLFSFTKRLDLMKKYDIRGFALWRKGFELEDIYEIIRRVKYDTR
jgi:spore germination protein YaaH